MTGSDTTGPSSSSQRSLSVRDLLRKRFIRRSKIELETPLQSMVAKADAAAPADAWVAYTTWTNTTGKPITSFESTWIVPSDPPNKSNQILYLFNSLEIPEAHILQPVLLWGTIDDIPGSGNFWTIGSWWVNVENEKKYEPFYLTELTRVKPGEKLTGRITMYRRYEALFDYSCEFVGRAGTKLLEGNLPELTTCTETLEAYSIGGGDNYPDTEQTVMSGITMQIGGVPTAFTWTPGGEFKPKVVPVPGGSEVHIIYPRNKT